MNDTVVSQAQEGPEAPWLLLIHQLPPKPDYLRVKVRRRLRQLRAIALKNSVYLLRNTEEALEDFTWLTREIEADGGSAMVCQAEFVEGISDEEIESMLEAEHTESAESEKGTSAESVKPGRIWVTRENVFVDRIASAWLIRRFIDPNARFKFVPARGYQPKPDELRFDMFQAEYTHEGDHCTFQTLLDRFVRNDPALTAIGEIVHDIDCKDDKFDRPETQGIARLVRGVADSIPKDADRVERGSAIFDDLYASFRKSRKSS
jgi:hypothetical protein